jgi:hypothetical protein
MLADMIYTASDLDRKRREVTGAAHRGLARPPALTKGVPACLLAPSRSSVTCQAAAANRRLVTR